MVQKSRLFKNIFRFIIRKYVDIFKKVGKYHDDFLSNFFVGK